MLSRESKATDGQHVRIFGHDYAMESHVVIVSQLSVGAIELWKATQYWHTSSVDEAAYLRSLRVSHTKTTTTIPKMNFDSSNDLSI